MTNEQLNHLLLMIDALRIAVLATIPASEKAGAEEACEASDRIAENALETILDVGPTVPAY